MLATIDGLQIAYDDTGNGDVLVLLHGFALDRRVWDAQAAALSSICRVIRPDLRGSGESGAGNGPALMETLAGDVFGLLEALDIERAVIAGHAMGGYVALAYYRMYAERVAGLGLLASRVTADDPVRTKERGELIAALHSEGVAAVVDTALRAVGPRSAVRVGLLDHLRAIVTAQNPGAMAAQTIGIRERLDSTDLLEDIDVAALVVAGAADPQSPFTLAERIAAGLLNCELVRLPGCGHFPMLEEPQRTSAALERLIRRAARSKDPQNVRVTRA